MGSGGLFFDYDADGWLDIFLVDGGSLTRPGGGQDGAPPSVPQPRQRHASPTSPPRSGSAHRDYGMGACSADYDNDGWPDLYVTSVGAEHAVSQQRRQGRSPT